MPDTAAARACGPCSLCCSVLRVDELGKPGGSDCVHQRSGPAPCSIHATRPQVCRGYRCLWLQGGLEDADRPDRLGAVLDVAPVGELLRLEIRQARPGVFDASPRLQEIAARYLETVPVRITDVADPLDPDAPYRVLFAGGVEHRVAGDRVRILRDGELVDERRLPWLERRLRQAALWWSGLRLRAAARNRPQPPEGGSVVAGAGFARLVLGLSALAFGGIGAAFLVAPEAMAARAGIALGSVTALQDVRAVYGGLQLGLAGLLAWCALDPGRLRMGLGVQLVTFAGLGGARLLSLGLDGVPDALGLALHGAELVGLACGAAAWARLGAQPGPPQGQS